MKHAYGRALADFAIPGQDTAHKLMPAEETLLQSVRRGDWSTVGDGSRPDERTDENEIRGAFLRFLVLGGDDETPVHEKGVQVSGGFVSGDIDLKNCRAEVPLSLTNCQIDGNVNLVDAATRLIWFAGSSVKKISAFRAQIRGGMLLRGHFVAAEGVDINGATIIGPLDISGGKTPRVDAQACHVIGSVHFTDSEIDEGIDFAGARIDQDLVLIGGRFSNRSRFALSDEGEIQREPRCDFAIDARETTIRGTLWLGAAAPPNNKDVVINGSLDLRGADVTNLVDHKDSWPVESVIVDGVKLPCYIFLDGFKFDRFSGRSSVRSHERMAWLKRQPPEDLDQDFKPQPFEHMAKVFREIGHTERARKILHLREKLRANSTTELTGLRDILRSYAKRKFNRYFFGPMVGYGYYPMRLIVAAVLLWLVSAAFFHYSAQRGIMAPTAPIVFLHEDLAVCRGNWVACDHDYMTNEHSPFQPLVYALDVIVPIVPFGQEDAWAPMVKPIWGDGNGALGAVDRWSTTWLVWFNIVFGWIVGLALVAVVSGAIKRD